MKSINGLCEHIIENMLNGFAHCKCIYNEQGHLVDWIYLFVNKSFEHLTRLSEAEGNHHGKHR